MLTKITLKCLYYVLNDEGKEVSKSRMIQNINYESTNDVLNQLAGVYETLTNEEYHTVEKLESYIIN